MRLDVLLVRRGLARSRGHARDLVAGGCVTVAGVAASKVSQPCTPDIEVEVRDPNAGMVGRGGVKLAGALADFAIDPRGRTGADFGASTGGFTQVLLHAGVRRVYSIDVGHGQLAVSLRDDPRVVDLPGTRVESAATVVPESCGIVVADLSFITSTVALEPARQLMEAAPAADAVILVKPQFELGPTARNRRGVVGDAQAQVAAVDFVIAVADELSLECLAVAPAKVTGTHGNQEYFVHLRPRRESRPA